jgi:hypothetical protein
MLQLDHRDVSPDCQIDTHLVMAGPKVAGLAGKFGMRGDGLKFVRLLFTCF